MDDTPWARPYAQTSPQRGWVHHSMRHTNGKPYVPGRNYQWLVQLSPDRDLWTAPLEARRIAPDQDPATGQRWADPRLRVFVRRTYKTGPATCCVSRPIGGCRPRSNQAERDLRPSKIQQNISGRLTSDA